MVASAAMPTETLLIFWLSAGGLIGFVFYALKGDLMIAVCAWLFTLMTLHEEFWRMPVPLFFAVTIPRLAIGVLALLLVAMLVLGRFRIRAAWPITGWLLAVIAYFFVSALVTGFQTRSVVSIHYRLIGGYFFPFLVFILILHAVQREVHVRRVALYFAALSVYLGFTGWCEQFGLDALIWPSFIRNPEVGIHWGRVRGPFVLSPAMGLALTYCFFSNLVLARNVRQGRWMLYLLDAGMIPPIFWTKTRSVWLAFVLCCMIWAVYSRRRTMRVVSVSVLLAALLAIAVLNMENFLTPERAKGGLTDTDPILLRIGLAQMTWEIVQAHPWFGLGFGHFRDFAPGFVNDPSSPFYAFGSTALEHNNLLSIAAETGVIGVGLYIAMMVALFRSSIRLYRRLPPSASGFFSRDAVVLYWILAAAYFIDGTFRETSDNPFANSLFFGLSAIPVALGILLRREPVRDRLMVGGPA
jgi:O-antigen ligase